MGRVMNTLGGIWALVLLAASSGFRLGGRYWRWRRETAFGRDSGARPGPWRRVRATLEYGRWVHRMKRGHWY
jgi:hypothetical protein